MNAAVVVPRRRIAMPLVLASITLVVYFSALNRSQPLIWGVAAVLSAESGNRLRLAALVGGQADRAA